MVDWEDSEEEHSQLLDQIIEENLEQMEAGVWAPLPRNAPAPYPSPADLDAWVEAIAGIDEPLPLTPAGAFEDLRTAFDLTRHSFDARRSRSSKLKIAAGFNQFISEFATKAMEKGYPLETIREGLQRLIRPAAGDQQRKPARPTSNQSEDRQVAGAYPSAKTYARDEWIYKNIHLNSYDTLSVKLNKKAKTEKWAIISSRNGLKNAADRHADYHELEKRRFKKH
jgi:hypothetical protein